jgi:hypothetical protein
MTIKKADIVLSSDAIFTGLTHEPTSGAIAILGDKAMLFSQGLHMSQRLGQ